MSLAAAFDWRSRTRAALVHLSGSAAVALIGAGLVFGLWYPSAYRAMAGGSELFVLLVSVDVVLGPLITWAIFDRRKAWPVLRRDLIVVVALQLAALAYGMHTVFIARPAVMALEGNRFRLVPATDVLVAELPKARPEFKRLSVFGPRLVRAAMPNDPGETFEAIQLSLGGFDLGTRPSAWRVWDEAAAREALSAAKPLVQLARRQEPAARRRLDEIVHSTGVTYDRLGYLPVIARHGDWVALLDRADGTVAGFAPLNGF